MENTNNLYSSLVNFYNVNDSNFKEFMASFYQELLANHRDIDYVKKHLHDEIRKKLREIIANGELTVDVENVVDDFLINGLEENKVITDIKKKLKENDTTLNINNLVTLTTGIQDKNCTKSNKNISLTFRTDNTTIATGTIIGNIDSSIRPKTNIVVPCVGLNGAGNSIQAYGQARLKTNGDIEVTLSTSCSFLAVSFSYNI